MWPSWKLQYLEKNFINKTSLAYGAMKKYAISKGQRSQIRPLDVAFLETTDPREKQKLH